MATAYELAAECVKRSIPVEMRWDKELKQVVFEVSGFSKSGTATLTVNNEGKVVALARYDTKTLIESFEDLESLAWYWYIGYADREPFNEPSSYWVKSFLERGWLVKEVETKTTYKRA